MYEIRWPALRGLNAAAPGLGGKARFTTGVGDDVAAPTFAGVTGLTWDFERTHDDCIDDLVDRFVFDIDLGAGQRRRRHQRPDVDAVPDRRARR